MEITQNRVNNIRKRHMTRNTAFHAKIDDVTETLHFANYAVVVSRGRKVRGCTCQEATGYAIYFFERDLCF